MSERLTDDQITERVAQLRRLSRVVSPGHRRAYASQLSAYVEIQERRAADLTPDEIETVREILAWEDGCDDVIAVCRKILSAHGAKP